MLMSLVQARSFDALFDVVTPYVIVPVLYRETDIHSNHMYHRQPGASYLHLSPMEWIPDAPHALVDTRDGLAQLPILLARAVPQQLGLLPHTLILQVPDAYRPLGAVGVMCGDDGVAPWARAHGDFDLWVVAGKGRQRGFYERVHAS
jgi:hypothetical protein